MGPPRHGRACPGHPRDSAHRTPESEQQGESFAIARPRQYETRFCGGIMDGRDKPAMTRLVLRGAIGTGADQHLTL